MTRVMRNTLISVLVLFVISAVSVLLLSLANHFIKTVVKLDDRTVALINKVAPTGLSNEEAASQKRVKIVDLAAGEFTIKSLDDFNKANGSASKRIIALYSSEDSKGKITYVVESKAMGRDGDIVMVTSFSDDNKILKTANKSNIESYWDELVSDDVFFAKYTGLGGTISSGDIAANTGATSTLNGITDAVNIAITFKTNLGGVVVPKPEIVTSPSLIANLKFLSSAAEFTMYPVKIDGKINAVYLGDNGDIIYQSLGNGGTYGGVTMLSTVSADKKLVKTFLKDKTFSPDYDGESGKINNELINSLYAGKTAADIKAESDGLAGITNATQSTNGVRQALVNALEYAGSFNKEDF